ncbi:DUF1573 domain-containing protein [Persicobacter diffluens]
MKSSFNQKKIIMKSAWIIFWMLVFSSAVFAQQHPIVKWENEVVDFGEITEGEEIEVAFAVVNEGGEPLIISKVMSTCGCTIPEWPHDPIYSGEKSKIVVKFNSTGKVGRQNKLIRVVCNVVEGYKVLRLSGQVVPKEMEN